MPYKDPSKHRANINTKARAAHTKRMADPEYARTRSTKLKERNGTPEAKEKKQQQSSSYYELNKDRVLARQKKVRKLAKTDSKLAEKLYRQQRNSDLKRQYSITLLEYEEMSAAQNHRCAICQEPETLTMDHTQRTHSLAVDHDHKTGEIRGLLCHGCNKALGHMKDSPERLLLAAAYLMKAERAAR